MKFDTDITKIKRVTFFRHSVCTVGLGDVVFWRWQSINRSHVHC